MLQSASSSRYPRRRRTSRFLGHSDVTLFNWFLPDRLRSRSLRLPAHLNRPVSLLETTSGRKGRRAVEAPDVVETEEAAFEYALAEAAPAVHPPGEVQSTGQRSPHPDDNGLRSTLQRVSAIR